MLDHLNTATLNARTRWLTQPSTRLSHIAAKHSRSYNEDLKKLDKDHLCTNLLAAFPSNKSVSLLDLKRNLSEADFEAAAVLDNRVLHIRRSDPLYNLRKSLRRTVRTLVRNRMNTTRLVRVREKLRDRQENDTPTNNGSTLVP